MTFEELVALGKMRYTQERKENVLKRFPSKEIVLAGKELLFERVLTAEELLSVMAFSNADNEEEFVLEARVAMHFLFDTLVKAQKLPKEFNISLIREDENLKVIAYTGASCTGCHNCKSCSCSEHEQKSGKKGGGGT